MTVYQYTALHKLINRTPHDHGAAAMQTTINYIFADAAEAFRSTTVSLHQLRDTVAARYPGLAEHQMRTALDALASWGWQVDGRTMTATRRAQDQPG